MGYVHNTTPSFSLPWPDLMVDSFPAEQLKALGITSSTPSAESSPAASDDERSRPRSKESDNSIISFVSPDRLDLSAISAYAPDHSTVGHDEPSTPTNSNSITIFTSRSNSGLITDSDASPSPLHIPRVVATSTSQGPHTPPPLTKPSPKTALSSHPFTPPNQQKPAANLPADHKLSNI